MGLPIILSTSRNKKKLHHFVLVEKKENPPPTLPNNWKPEQMEVVQCDIAIYTCRKNNEHEIWREHKTRKLNSGTKSPYTSQRECREPINFKL
jgi:hypothetical protein